MAAKKKAEPKTETKKASKETLTALVNIPASMSPTGLRIDRGAEFEAGASDAKHFRSLDYAK